jgi:hypothetical protein
MKCKVRQLILKPLLEKSTLSTHRKVQNFQVQVQKLQMQRVESSKVKILRSRKVLPSQICLCYSLISISSFSIVKLLHCRSGRVAYNGFALGAVGDLEALNCQPAPKLNRSTNFQFCSSPPPLRQTHVIASGSYHLSSEQACQQRFSQSCQQSVCSSLAISSPNVSRYFSFVCKKEFFKSIASCSPRIPK